MPASFESLLNSLNVAYGQARQANESRYAQVLSGYEDRFRNGVAFLQGLGGTEANDIANRYAGAQGKATQDLVSRGLYNTTVAPAIQRGLAADQTREQGALQERLRGQYLGAYGNLYKDQLDFMERRNDITSIDPGMIAQLGMAAAARDAAVLGGDISRNAGAFGGGGGFIGGTIPRGPGIGGAPMQPGPQGMVPDPYQQRGFGPSNLGAGVFGQGGTEQNFGGGSSMFNPASWASNNAGSAALIPGYGNLGGAYDAYNASVANPYTDWGYGNFFGMNSGGQYGGDNANSTGNAFNTAAPGGSAASYGYGGNTNTSGGRMNLNERPGISPVYDGQNYWSYDGGQTWAYEPGY